MAPNPRIQDDRLNALWAALPKMECQGKCANRCWTTMMMSLRERARIKEATGEDVTADAGGECTMLEEGRCKAYAIRPTFCRLWGMTEDMKCPYGCKPWPRYLTPQEGAEVLWAADRIGGKGDTNHELRKVAKLVIQGLC